MEDCRDRGIVAMRWAIAGLLVAGGMTAILWLGWSGMPSAPDGREEGTWQLRELMFLKAAYDRMQQDMGLESEGSASLREEQKRILRLMNETAKLLPGEAVPAELRPLLLNAEAAPSSLSRLIGTITDEEQAPERISELAEGQLLDLRVGLPVASGDGPVPAADAVEFALDPELREPLRPEPARERATRRKPRDDTGRSE
jgi:hypothetical protein